MNLRTIAARTAIAGTATALAAGALVSLSATAANAETGSAEYSCTNTYTTDVIPVVLSLGADLSSFPSVPTGFAVPAGLLPVDASLTIPAEAVAGLEQNGITSVGISDSTVSLPFGDSSVPLTGITAASESLGDGDLVIPFDGATNGAFKVPGAGDQSVKMPSTFTTTAVTNLIGLPLTCTVVGDQPTIASLTVTKQSSSAKVAGPASVKKGKVAKYVVTVAGSSAVTPTGKVVAKDGKTSLGSVALKNGKATFSVKKLKAGKNKLTFSYAGDKNTTASSVSKTVTVKK